MTVSCVIDSREPEGEFRLLNQFFEKYRVMKLIMNLGEKVDVDDIKIVGGDILISGLSPGMAMQVKLLW